MSGFESLCAHQFSSCGQTITRWTTESPLLLLVQPVCSEQEVRHAAGARHGLEVEPVEQVVGGGPESLAAAELDRRDGDVHGVDEVRLEELPNGGDAAAEPYVLAVSGVGGLLQRLRGRGIEEVERGVGQREAGSGMVGEDEDGGVEGGVLPTSPSSRGPPTGRAADRTCCGP